ncbi:hypothetical protein C7441_11029 [Pseudaminobacter salicylatoxidans]|uniref:Uncharacterized protein n=1 Tax=Pseudaminobacter salicylatoxidans TaxID=93369 RepID=A0A316C2B9_PSESE|nr:hypothetical protein [Pseudaminobacter salicylatoxidans]PWJ81497.1 hypothetical protein C7441_11029 [Pseudaminobacter salicylatoxidans]
MRLYRRSAVDTIEREAIAETRRRFMEALERGLSHDEAVAYANGHETLPTAPAPASNTPASTSNPSTVEPREKQRAVDLTGWEELPYVPRSAGAPNLKALASQVSNDPIRNKVQAEEAIRAELALREKEDAEARAAVTIPDGWEALTVGERIALAATLTTDTVETEGDAERVIQIELARRSAGE